jgi:hypothetical protein
MNKLTKLTLHFLHPVDGGKLTASLDSDLTPIEVSRELEAAKFLEEKWGIRYDLVNEHGQILPHHEPLRKLGVKSGATLKVSIFWEDA